MKSLTALWQKLAEELGQRARVSTARDFKTVTRRVEHEGLSFLTISLPSFCKDLEKALEDGKVGHDLFQGFSRRGGLPRFLGGFLDLVFDRSSGFLLDEPDSDAIYSIRQLTLVFGKIALPCSDARNKRALSKYIECELMVKEGDRTLDKSVLTDFSKVALWLFGDVFASVDRDIYECTLIPKHGPGKTADRISGNAKFDQVEWTQRLEEFFPYGEYALPNWRFNYLLTPVHHHEPGTERPVKVVLVPKTLKTPRVIAIEPTCMQYIQQAVMEGLVKSLESDPWVSTMIGFSDQVPNQRLARIGSINGSIATIDLSEASDRVSNQHVRSLVRHFPHLFGALDACRSRKADVPGHGVIRLAKFASMGSAVCFPVEAMVFLTIVCMGIMQHRNQWSRSAVRRMRDEVRVYGDDICIPADCTESVIKMLEVFSLVVNKDKSFWNGQFRESCGKEYYAGHDVSVTRVRSVFPSSPRDVDEVVATVSLRNRLYEAGLWKTAFWMDPQIESLLWGNYPVVAPSSPVLGRVSFLGYETQRIDKHLHAPRVKGFVQVSQPPASPLTGEGALLKYFLKRGEEPIADRKHLTHSGRPKSSCLKLRWAQPF